MVKLIKRVISVLLLAAAALVLVFGSRADTAPVKDRVVVQYWEKWTGNEGEQMQQIVDWFNDTVGKEKDIYVQCLSMSSINQKTLVSTAGGVPPDVAGLWDGQVCQFAAIDALQPLDDLVAAKGITPSYYKPVYWKACQYGGKLYALISTPAAVALHYDKQAFLDHADKLRAAGLDPDRPPRTLDELNKYAEAIDTFEPGPGGGKRLLCAGYLPMEPGWFLPLTGYWFDVDVFDEKTQTLQVNNPRMVEALDWIQSYSKRLGVETMGEFRSGFGQFNSTQNPFLTGTVAMVQQGPWMANYIENLKPAMNRWHLPPDLQKLDEQLAEEVRSGKLRPWDRMLKWASLVPADVRRKYCSWGAVPFPSAVPGLENVTYCGFDTLVIPRGAKHPTEAFEFIAFVNRQDVMEKLCTMHCKNSPLAKVSEQFIRQHPNPYIEVFEQLSASPNAHGLPEIGIWPQINDELTNAIQEVYLMQKNDRKEIKTPKQALDEAQARVQGFYEKFLMIQRERERQ